jgi:hypothetical protein
MCLKFYLATAFGLIALAGQANADCSARFSGYLYTVLPSYNPFSPTDILTQKNLQIHNLSGENCRYRIYFRRNPAIGQLSSRLRYSVIDDQNQSLLLENVGFSASRFLLSPPASGLNTQTVSYSVNVERGQIASPAVLADRIEVVLFSENGQTEIDRRDLYIWITVESVSMVNLAGGGVGTTVQFGNLTTGMTRSLILEARSNTQYMISFVSSNAGSLQLDPPVPGRVWSVPYRILVDGSPFDLSRLSYLQGTSPTSGQQSHSITFQIINADGKRAGSYKDVITARISPVH